MSVQNDEKSMLKSAQFRSLLLNNGRPAIKDIESILEGVNPNLKLFDPHFPEKRYGHWIGSTPLQMAYENANIEAYNILIRKGADINAKNEKGNTVLHEMFHSLCRQSISQWWDIKKNQRGLVSEGDPFILSTLSAHVQSKNNDNPASSNGLTHFHIACATNNIEAVEFFLRNGVSVNQVVTKAISNKYFEGYSPLHFAAQFGHREVVKVLLKYGAIANLVDTRGKTPFDISIERNIAMIDSITQVYSDTDVFDNERAMNLLWSSANTKLPTLCIISAFQNCNQAKRVLSKEFRDVNQLCISTDSPSWPGYRTLHFAAHVNIDTVKILLSYGTDIDAKNANGVTPFDLCIERYKAEDIADVIRLVPKWQNILLSDEKTKLTDLLVAFKDSSGIRNFSEESDENVNLLVPFNSTLWPGFTVLHIAVLFSGRRKCKFDYKKKEQTEVLRRRPRQDLFQPDLTVITECLKRDADVTAKDQRGWTPIHFAFRLGRKKVVELLLQYHHRMTNTVDDENLSHLHVACEFGNLDLVRKLLWNGADVNVAYKGDSTISCVHPGWTPLHVAVYKQNCEIVKLLLKFDANVHAMDKLGFTPIHGVNSNNLYSQEIGKMLFSVSNLRDFVVPDLGLSYLHVACSTHNVDAVKRLLDLGVEVNKVITCKNEGGANFQNEFRRKCYDGDTPLHCTLKKANSPVSTKLKLVNLLLERGADMLIKNSSKTCPLIKILNSKDLLNIALDEMNVNEDLRKRAKMETGVTMLHLAIRKMDVILVEDFLDLDEGTEVNTKIHDDSSIWAGCTPLNVMMLGGYDAESFDDFVKIMKLLLDHGADVTLGNKLLNRSPLQIAYRKVYAYSDISTVQLTPLSLMLKAYKNFEVNPTCVQGVSYFHIACHILDVDVVEKFLEHDVDVNLRIDMYYDWNIAASTPLLLACRTMYWGQADYVKSLSESFAQLKIVDLLIKRGARVNVEDIYGNTPAHYAGFGNSSKENLLVRLANSGADVNARNLRGQTPLELLLKKASTLEEIRDFIACGCILNSFNTLTDDGYIALADSLLTHEDMQRLLFGAFVNSPELMKRDDINRSVIHNMVSSNHPQSYEEHYTDLLDISIKFGCDVDEQDSLGRTALHLAAQFRNHEAVAALLLVGADINITDNNGKTPFAYVFEACSRCDTSDEDHDIYIHINLFRVFVTQVIKLQLCNLDLHKSNERLLRETFERFSPDDFGNEVGFISEVAEISKFKVEPYSVPLENFVLDPVAIIDYSLMSQDKRKAIDNFFRANKSHFQTKFKKAAGIFQLQYRQAVLRRKIIDEAKDSLSMLMNFRLPDICSHIVLRLLKNSELQNLILSAS